MFNFTFYISLGSFIVFFGAGIYFFTWWLKSNRHHQFLLYFALGLGGFLWFKIPNILANAHIEIVQQDFYLFFFVTLLAHFLAYFSIIKGLTFFTEFSYKKSVLYYFSLTFFVPGFDLTYAPVWASHLLFFIPVQLCILYELWHIAKNPVKSLTVPFPGVMLFGTGTGVIFLIASSLFYIFVQIWPYPQEFWYFAVTTSTNISFLQIISGLFLFFGLCVLSQSYIRAIKN